MMARVKLGDVASEVRTTWAGETAGVPVVGLEHLVPRNIQLQNWSVDVADSTFTKAFKKGQVLLGRRRVYLKKAVLAPFDGICSGDITVIESKPEKLLPRLLPFIIQNEKFFDYAMQGSAGSLSPRVKWPFLAKYEFNLPPIEEQRRLADLLWAANDLKEAYRHAISASDEMAKARFVEMFGDCKRERLQQFIQQIRGVSFKPDEIRTNPTEGYIPLLRANNICMGKINLDGLLYVDCKKVSKEQIIRPNDILICASSGSQEHVGKAALCNFSEEQYTYGAFCKIARAKSTLSARYILSYLCSAECREEIMKKASCGTNINNLRTEYIDDLLIPIPDKDAYDYFASFIEQLDATKAALSRSIEDLDKTIKALLNQALEA